MSFSEWLQKKHLIKITIIYEKLSKLEIDGNVLKQIKMSTEIITQTTYY